MGIWPPMKPAQLFATFALLCLAFIFAGCDPDRDYTKLGTNPQPKTDGTEQALEDKAKADNANLSKVRANIQAAKKANDRQAPGKEKDVVNGELSLADNRVSNVTPDKEEAQAAEQRAELIYQGKAEEAARLYNVANKVALEEVEKRAKLEQKLQDALEQQEKERKAYLEEVDRLKAYAAKLQDAEKSKQALTLRLIGIGFIAVFGLAVGFGHIAGLRLGWVFGVIGLLFLGVAQVVALWWFKWACFGLVAAVALFCAWWVYQRHRENTLAEDLKKKETALKKLVPILDNAYESITDEQKEVKQWVETKVFGALSGVMGEPDKATIHKVRAQNAEGS